MVTMVCEHCKLEFDVPFEESLEERFCPNCGNFAHPKQKEAKRD